MCFKLWEDRRCIKCPEKDRSERVIHCLTILEAGEGDGMMDRAKCDAVMKNPIIEVLGGSYICDDCQSQGSAEHQESDQHRDYVQRDDSDQHRDSALNISQECLDHQQTHNGRYQPQTPPRDAQQAQSTTEVVSERCVSRSYLESGSPLQNAEFLTDRPVISGITHTAHLQL